MARPEHRRPDGGFGDRSPNVLLVLLRGIARRCPRCGSGGLFRRWFALAERCPRCGLRLEREEGAFLGSITISYGVTGVVFMVLLITWIAIDSPDVRYVPLGIAAAAVSLIIPVVFYPFAKTIWSAIDFLSQTGEPQDDTGAGPVDKDER